jgi:CDP-glycerol glycerophosphotransferase (TagB/SpsB family)
MLVSDILVSDTSSIRFDYAFLYGKPVVTLDIPREKQLEYEGQYMSEIWTDAAAKRLGRVLGHDDLDGVVPVITSILESGKVSDVREFRSETIVNLGTSAKAVVDIMLSEAEQDV